MQLCCKFIKILLPVLNYQIAITQIPGIGDINAKKIIAYCGSLEAVFKEKKQKLLKIPGIGEILAETIIQSRDNALKRAETEIEFIQKHNIKTFFYLNDDYPLLLKDCLDSPVILYYKGNASLKNNKIISIIGTRNATEYGKEMCKNIIKGLSGLNVLVLSGLAFGIDICAHKATLDNNLSTVGVLAHGLDRIYPVQHKPFARQMVESNGGLLTEYISKTNPDRENFPSRNRIVAGMSHATLVIESAKKGGALITAEIANSYNKDVFAIPGRIGDKYSEGCHYLIKNNKAAMVESAEDIVQMMGWETSEHSTKNKQTKIFIELSADEEKIVNILKEQGESSIDFLCSQSSLSMSKTASALLNLEFEGIVKNLPGKLYKLL